MNKFYNLFMNYKASKW